MWCISLLTLSASLPTQVFLLFFFSFLLPLLFIFLFPSLFILSSHQSLSLSSTVFLKSALTISESIANHVIIPPFQSPLPLTSFLNASLSSSSQWISCCWPELKVTHWLVQGLQHRTWVLPVPPARVLCCSQWSCLSAPPPVCLLLDRAPGTGGPHQLWTCLPGSSLYFQFECDCYQSNFQRFKDNNTLPRNMSPRSICHNMSRIICLNVLSVSSQSLPQFMSFQAYSHSHQRTALWLHLQHDI